MVKVYKGTDHEFYMDGYLQNVLDTAKTVIKKDWDMIFIIDGSEGSGKSVLATQCAKYCDEKFVIDKIVFGPSQFRKAIIDSEPYQAIVYDEAYTGLSSRATMSLINRTLVSMLAEIRQKNLFVFVVMPTFFDLDRYVALWRSRALIHVYTSQNFERGFMAFYDKDLKKDLFVTGKKFYNYRKPRPNFIGRFTNHYVVEEKEYRKVKKNALVTREKKVEDLIKRKELEAELFERVVGCDTADKITHKLKAEMLGMSIQNYYLKLKKWKEDGELKAI